MNARTAILCMGVTASLIIADLSLAQQSAPASKPAAVIFSERELTRIYQHSPLGPPPADRTNAVAGNPTAAQLGQFLFFDTRLSGNGRLSCASCHNPRLAFADGKKLAEGAKRGNRRTLSLLNVAYNRWFFWDGRADTLWSQALKPIENNAELAGSRTRAVQLLDDDAELRAAYEKIFGPLPAVFNSASSQPAERQTAINRVFSNLGKAIAAYERRLISNDSPFDRFVLGLKTGDAEKRNAISESAQRGLKLFIGRANCRTCHSGPNFTDHEFHDIRLPNGGNTRLTDAGRFTGIDLVQHDPFNAAGVYSDDRTGSTAERTRRVVNSSQSWGQFKTPGLRNVARAGPHMHQGQFDSLADVVRYYSTFKGAAPADQHQEKILVPLGLSEDEVSDLVAFLESLSGSDPAPRLMRKPVSPLIPDP